MLFICSIIGKCKLNKLQIYANNDIHNNFVLNITIENYHEDVSFNFDKIKIYVSNCKNNQIKMYKNHISYCENAQCLNSCSNNTLMCKPYYKERINDVNLNECICNKGWDGKFCDIKQFIDFK